MIDRSTESTSERSLGENPSGNSVVDWGAVKIKREREVQGKNAKKFRLRQRSDSTWSCCQLSNISTCQHLNISTSLSILRMLQGILLNLFDVVHTRNGGTKLFGISTSPNQSLSSQPKLGSGPSIYCRSFVLGIWRPVTLDAHKNPCLDFPLYILNLLSEGFGEKQRISHSARIISGSKGLRFII